MADHVIVTFLGGPLDGMTHLMPAKNGLPAEITAEPHGTNQEGAYFHIGSHPWREWYLTWTRPAPIKYLLEGTSCYRAVES